MPESIELRDVTEGDLAIFFEHQLDAAANRMAAFTAKDPSDRAAFMARWAVILGDDTMVKKTILCGGRVAGHVASFERSGDLEVTYWLGREFWGRGVATAALTAFLSRHMQTRPLYARVAKDNVASRRVLEKCGFTAVGEDVCYSCARQAEVPEVVLELAGAG